MPSPSISGLYITRRRKKWKFAHFDSFENCFSFKNGDDVAQLHQKLSIYLPSSDQPRSVLLEIAAGTAQLSLELARRNPTVNYIAIDVKADRLYTAAKQALEFEIKNIVFLRMHLDQLAEVFTPSSVQTIWLTFPDPFPRLRSAKHRLTHSAFLTNYKKVLKRGGRLKFKTDNRELFLWSLEQFVVEKWQLTELSFDLHEADLSEEAKIMTTYEQKYVATDIPINYVELAAYKN